MGFKPRRDLQIMQSQCLSVWQCALTIWRYLKNPCGVQKFKYLSTLIALSLICISLLQWRLPTTGAKHTKTNRVFSVALFFNRKHHTFYIQFLSRCLITTHRATAVLLSSNLVCVCPVSYFLSCVLWECVQFILSARALAHVCVYGFCDGVYFNVASPAWVDFP